VKQFYCFFVVALLALSSVAVELPFPVGETLEYSISWNGIPVAYATATTSVDTFEGREVLALRLRAQTYSFFNHIFKVDDHHESLVDPETFLPIRFTKNIKEGSYRCHEITTFDFEKRMAYYEHQTNGSKKDYAIDADTRDIFSFMYFMRSELLEPDQTTKYRVMSDEKVYDLILNTDDVDRIGLPHYKQKVPSLEMVPEAMFDGLFVRKGKATLWVSRDPRRLLTFAKIKVPFGRARIKLQEVRGPGTDFWITERQGDDD
jgi:hypothetical protein